MTNCFMIIIKGVKTDTIKRSGFRYYLEQLDSFLSTYLGRDYVQTRKDREALQRWRSVQFSYKGILDVDLLVSPYWGDEPTQLYRFLQSVDDPSK